MVWGALEMPSSSRAQIRKLMVALIIAKVAQPLALVLSTGRAGYKATRFGSALTL
jgi:hypothetical protein